MRISIYLTFLLSLMSLAGCGIGGHWMTGDPSAGKNVKPYGAHWVKEGMTRESRREDSWACGAARTVVGAEHPVFPNDQLKAAKLPTDLNDILADSRLTKSWASCMKTKGYVYQQQCDERCLYP